MLYSGTVAAAIEGAFFQLHQHRRVAGIHQAQAARLPARRRPGPAGHRADPGHQARAAASLFNVNIPSLDKGPIRGIRVVPQNVAPYVETFDRRIDPRGRVYFWSDPDFGCPEPHPDTDVTALARGLHHRDAAAVQPDACRPAQRDARVEAKAARVLTCCRLDGLETGQS